MTPEPLRLVIFDCDGVLVDSEALSARIVAREITRLGWPMTTAESLRLFVGFRLSDIPPVVQAHLGHPIPPDWVETVRAAMIDAFDAVEAMPGAEAVLRATASLGLAFRVASNSSHEEMNKKFTTTGLAALIGGRQHSARDVTRGKPAPDVFLAAAAAEGVPPGACLVVEDSEPGIAAAQAAGMAVVGLETAGNAARLREIGATPIKSLSELPAIVRAASRQAA